VTYLHYHFTDETLKTLVARENRKARVAEMEINVLHNAMRRMRGQAQIDHARRDLHVLYTRFNNAQAASDKYQEDLNWREDPDALIELYKKSGYKLVYLCGNGEFDTEDVALSEARFLHTLNDVHREFGADGDGIEDMLDPDDMVQAAFVMIEKRESREP